MIKNIFIILIFIVALQFFNIYFLGKDILNILEPLVLILSIIVIMYNKCEIREVSFTREMVCIGFSVFLSMIGSYLYHDQSYYITFIASRFMYLYIIYFVFHALGSKATTIENVIVVMSMVFAVLYIVAVYNPNIITSKIIEDTIRQTTRVKIPGVLVLVLGLFISISRYYSEILPIRKIYYLTISILFAGICIATGTRMIIFPLIVVVSIFIIKVYKIRLQTIIISSILVIVILYSKVNDIMNGLLYTIQNDLWGNLDGGNYFIRVNALQYFLNNMFKDWMNFILGNGIASTNSQYGREINYIKLSLKFYQSDLGILGDIIRYGIFFLIGVFMIFIKLFKQKLLDRYKYLQYYFVFVLVSSITLSHFGQAAGIIALSSSLYILDTTRKANK